MIAPRPLLTLHGAENELHRPAQAQALYRRAGEPKRLELLPGRSHTEWMFDQDPRFRGVIEMLDGFLAGAEGVRR